MTDSPAARLGYRRVTRVILRARLPLLAQSGHRKDIGQCPLVTLTGHGDSKAVYSCRTVFSS